MDRAVALVTEYLRVSGWATPRAVRFLAAGEYNANYFVDAEEGRFVFRVNHGSQLELDNQIEYEFGVLQAVSASGVTPRAFEYDTEPGEGLGNGVLLMGYLPGRPLKYREEFLRAADVFAAIHALPVAGGLIRQDRPMLDVSEESSRLLTRFEDHPLQVHRRKLLTFRDHIVRQADLYHDFFESDKPRIVNTEVNNGNFLVDGEDTYLVDWEKAVISSRYQDLGHFLVPTTTQWKGGYLFDRDERRRFLFRYRSALGRSIGEASGELPSTTDLELGTRLLESTIILRGLSWCFMAYYEYTKTDRSIRNDDTFKTIRRYMDEIDWFLQRGYDR